MSKNLNDTQRQMQEVNKLVSEQADVIKYLLDKVKNLEVKVVDLENRSRRRNMVFYGVADNDQFETWDKSEQLIKDICKTNLGIELKSVERAHRVGRYDSKAKRPIIVSLSSFKEKQIILSNTRKLKGTAYGIDEDYSPETRAIRKKLWKYAKVKKADKRNKVKLSFDKLIVNGRAFHWDKEKEEVVPFSKP